MVIKFSKLQATGNDFILLDARNLKCDWAKLAQDMCHRHFGIGADGLILLLSSKAADLKMRMFNPDGSEAEVCGNGLRCLAKYVIDRQIVPGPNLTVETLAGARTAQAFISRGKASKVKVNMGVPRFEPKDIPVTVDEQKKSVRKAERAPILDYSLTIMGEKLGLSLVSMGNPHAVCFVNKPVADFHLHEIGTRVENHPMFPQRINFEVARVMKRNKIEARGWERGVGETLSCGSGACAVAVIANLKGYADGEVDIILPGGALTVEWDGVGGIYLTGPVEEVFNGEWLR